MKKLVHFKTVLVLMSLLGGCGGGSSSGGGSGGSNGAPPSVNAGVDKEVNEQLASTLNAVGFPTGGSYSWTQTAGPVLTGFPAATESVDITAPTVKAETTLTFRVEYTTVDGEIVTDNVDVTVLPVNRPPVAIAQLKLPGTSPVPPDETIVLDASASFDQDADGSIVEYQWEQDGDAPVVSQLNGSSSVEFHFIAPQVANITAFPFKLTVTDDEGEESEYELTVNVDPALSVVEVSGGADRVVNEEQTVSLTATGDPVGGTFTWSQLSGDTLSNFPFNGATAEFRIPATKTVKNYEFRVQYKSPAGFIAYDQVKVTANPVNELPDAVVRVLTPTLLPAAPSVLVTLDGSASTDSDGEITEYNWSQISGSVSVQPESDGQEFKFRAPVQENPETYVFRLTVVDDEQGQGTFDIEIDIEGTSDLIVANAGNNQTVDEFTTITLDGSASFSSISSVSCSWRQLSGPTVSFTNPDNCISTVVAPNIDVSTDLIFELKATNSEGEDATDTTTVTVNPIALGKIGDSGQTLCYNQSSSIPCGDSSYPRQDGDYGRDKVSSFLDKVGIGSAGFDFTKLDDNGDELPSDSSNYACVRDNVTGLIWEIKTVSSAGVPNTPLRDSKNTYNWHFPDGSTGGEDGTAAGALTSCPSAADCGLETYTIEVNATVYCGAANWRVPTIAELQTIVDYSKDSDSNAVETDLFIDMPSSALQDHLYFWTSETSADGGGKFSAWVIGFEDGNDNSRAKASTAYVRLVRTP